MGRRAIRLTGMHQLVQPTIKVDGSYAVLVDSQFWDPMPWRPWRPLMPLMPCVITSVQERHGCNITYIGTHNGSRPVERRCRLWRGPGPAALGRILRNSGSSHLTLHGRVKPSQRARPGGCRGKGYLEGHCVCVCVRVCACRVMRRAQWHSALLQDPSVNTSRAPGHRPTGWMA